MKPPPNAPHADAVDVDERVLLASCSTVTSCRRGRSPGGCRSRSCGTIRRFGLPPVAHLMTMKPYWAASCCRRGLKSCDALGLRAG